MTTVAIFACRRCGHACFPARRLCPRCGGDAWDTVGVTDGVVEDVTSVRYRADAGGRTPQPVHLASVRTARNVVVLARLETPAAPGARVNLVQRPSGAVLGSP